jgi:hypothetical protein
MLLSYAMEGGDLAVAELVQNLGAEGAWAKIIEGVLGEPAAERAGRITIDVVERLAKRRRRASSFPAATSGRPDLMTFDMPKVCNAAAESQWGCGCAVPAIWHT